MLRRAASRGELRADLDQELFLESLLGLLFVRVVLRSQTITDAFIERVLDHAVRLASPR